MPLNLVTGPANAGKAGAVLDGYRAAFGHEPLLVVPTFADVGHYQRELASRGHVFGGSVLRFERLLHEIGRRTGLRARIAGSHQRRALVTAALRGLELPSFGAAARTPGFAEAAGDLVAELQRALVEPPRLAAALRALAGGDPGRERYGNDVSAIYFGYRRALEMAGMVDEDLFAWRVLDALRADPASWDHRPVFLYGFDDLTAAQRGTVAALAGEADAEVILALSHEPGREAFAARADTYDELAAIAEEVVHLPARDAHYDEGAREALHHLERRLFEPGGDRAPAGEAVRVLEASGERAEAELVAAEVLEALRGGTEPGDVAVVVRSPRHEAPLLAAMLEAYGVPTAAGRYVPLGHTPLGAGLLALLRCALPGGSAADLLAYLRTPGRLRRADLADVLEERLRREGVTGAGPAAERWEELAGWRLDELTSLRAACEGGTRAALEALAARAGALLAAPRRRTAALLDPTEESDARAVAAVQEAASELSALDGADALPEAWELPEVLGDIEVRMGERAGASGVSVLGPLDVRARRWRGLFMCGLQEGAFPRPARPEPFLPDDLRAELARASGLALALRDDALDRERHLFYACASRAEERLTLSWRSSDEEGNPTLPSPFLRDVAALFDGDILATPARRRGLADVTWPADAAPTSSEVERALALAGPRTVTEAIRPLAAPVVLARLGEAVFSPSALELYVGCPVRWLVERRLAPGRLEPDPEPLVRGRLLHEVLADALQRLRERTGSARVRPDTLDAAHEAVALALDARKASLPLSPHEPSARAELRRLERELSRYLEHEAAADGWEPAHLELAFGLPEAEHPVLELAGGEVRLRGQIDRVEVAGEEAIVRDYKSSKGHPYARWEDDGILQVGLYMLAVQALLSLRPVAGLYQPLRGDLRARGIVLGESGVPVTPEPLVDKDVVDGEALAECLVRVEEQACDVVRRIRAGELVPRPDTCAFRGGCAHPGICRSEGA